jgi:hypothetical protein
VCRGRIQLINIYVAQNSSSQKRIVSSNILMVLGLRNPEVISNICAYEIMEMT